ncbi:uncharacterized lipoprotein YddW (UPF0748 family) [Sedimentibacter acidaminivorans]|uniref:Uncharacterized lipoprotein YddW (UPF0748 family) n=1 Tax=Sedimentibacter acidaminivorans TaxID=913099 RepID=A0ABS4G8Z0_9FIRM|nr:family 10 glycosylhydrolase [Sedimentibacter acidaminivorans]MBP1924149.1 uncharacterized lipoprotein YddW (UPF0748 family) [Sedimentibacter acidaminivorans]
MRKLNKKIISTSLLMLLMTVFVFSTVTSSEINAVEKEFRGVWVSTVWGIDYPSKATTDEDKLKKDAIEMLDNIKDMGFNAVFLQVRSCSDAIYKSDIYPWSRFLTGTQGVAPENGFDPLEFFVQESHKRGLELHAWINPYRITATPTDNSKLYATNPAVLNPELTVLHSDGKLYFNPGEPRARELIISGVKEILDNYDVDGIHLDDYFYPDKNFEDEDTYAKYGSDFTDVNQWRINNNNLLIKEIGEIVHTKNSKVKFGVSPAGIWANKSTSHLGSDTDGWGTYVNQFADSRYWVKERYVDYIVPQIYWNIGFRIADYETLVSWWSDVVKGTGVKLYIGQAAYRTVGVEPSSIWYGGSEIKRQIDLNRNSSFVNGYCMFSYKSFLKNDKLYAMLKTSNKEDPTNDGTYFSDIENNPYEENIKYVASRSIVVGYDGRFNPEQSIKRADFVLMLSRLFEIESLEGLTGFDDVSVEDYYYKELATARKNGLILGVGDNKFNPEGQITRQDIFVMTYRAMQVLNMINTDIDSSVVDGYVDKNNISDYAVEAISYFTQNNILANESKAIFPVKVASRDEMADFLARLLKSDIMAIKNFN